MTVNASFLADVTNFIGEADLESMPSIVGIFYGFCSADGDDSRLHLEDFVEFDQAVHRRLIVAAKNDRTGIIVVADGGALAQELRVIGNPESYASLTP